MDCVLALLQSDSAPSWENPITTGFGAGEVSAGTISLFLLQPVRRETAASRQIPAFKILFCKRISFSRLSVNLYMLLYLIHRDLETKRGSCRQNFSAIRQKRHLSLQLPLLSVSLFCFQRFFLLGNYHTLYNKEETEHCCNGNSCPPRLVKTCRRYNVLNGA